MAKIIKVSLLRLDSLKEVNYLMDLVSDDSKVALNLRGTRTSIYNALVNIKKDMENEKNIKT